MLFNNFNIFLYYILVFRLIQLERCHYDVLSVRQKKSGNKIHDAKFSANHLDTVNYKNTNELCQLGTLLFSLQSTSAHTESPRSSELSLLWRLRRFDFRNHA